MTYKSNCFILTERVPQQAVSSVSATEHTAAANQLLAEARLLREQLAMESTKANHKLSEAVLAVIMYTETVENANRLLALADSCVGQIRSRMRAHGVPIHPPLPPSNVVTIPDAIPVSDVITTSDTDVAGIQGKSLSSCVRVNMFLRAIRRASQTSVRYYIHR